MVKNILVHALTLSRLPLSFAFCTAALHDANPFPLCAALFALIAASDYLDGRLARRFGVQSGIGAILDVMADFFYIFLACSTLTVRGLFPPWMLAVITLKFLEFWTTSIISKRGGGSTFLFDPLGRVAAVLLYMLPIMILLLSSFLSAVAHQTAVQWVCMGVAGLAALSSCRRILDLAHKK